MMQSRAMSAVESVANVAVGFGIAVAAQAMVFPAFGLHVAKSQHVAIAAIFTLISLVRSFTLRRAFEAIRVWNETRRP